MADTLPKEEMADPANQPEGDKKLMQLVPSANHVLAPMDSGAPKKKKMNLQWDDSQDIFVKPEGMKALTLEDVLAFNKNYEDSLHAQEQKTKDAQEKLDKKRAQFNGEGANKLKTPQAAPALQRGTFKRGEEVKKEATEPKDNDKTQPGNAKSNGQQDQQGSKQDKAKKGNEKDQNQQNQPKKAPKQKKDNQQNGKDQTQTKEVNDRPEGTKATPMAGGPDNDKQDPKDKKPAGEANPNAKGKKNAQNKQQNGQNQPQPESQSTQAGSQPGPQQANQRSQPRTLTSLPRRTRRTKTTNQSQIPTPKFRPSLRPGTPNLTFLVLPRPESQHPCPSHNQ